MTEATERDREKARELVLRIQEDVLRVLLFDCRGTPETFGRVESAYLDAIASFRAQALAEAREEGRKDIETLCRALESAGFCAGNCVECSASWRKCASADRRELVNSIRARLNSTETKP